MTVQEDHDVSGKNQYRDLCRQSNIIPCSYFMAHIQDRELVLRYHQFSTEDIRTIARTLSVRTVTEMFIEHFDCSSPMCLLNVYYWMAIIYNNKQRNIFLK